MWIWRVIQLPCAHHRVNIIYRDGRARTANSLCNFSLIIFSIRFSRGHHWSSRGGPKILQAVILDPFLLLKKSYSCD